MCVWADQSDFGSARNGFDYDVVPVPMHVLPTIFYDEVTYQVGVLSFLLLLAYRRDIAVL